MNQATAILEIEQKGKILIVKAAIDLQDFDVLELEEAANELSKHMIHSGVTDVILDIHRTDVLQSQAPRLAVELWKRVLTHGGSIAICLI